MRHCRHKCTMAVLALSFICLVSTNATAANLSLVPSKNLVVSGELFSVDVVVDNATEVAGCSVTVSYPSDAIELTVLPVTTNYFIPFHDTRAGVTPTMIDSWQSNTAVPGIVLFAGAIIDPDLVNGGGALYVGEQTLFTLHFRVKNTVPTGPYKFSLSTSSLFAAQAGWGIDINNNGNLDALDGDSSDVAPVLVLSYPKSSAQWNTTALDDDFAVTLASFAADPEAQFAVDGDNDNDGIPDSIDIDDDNDGMPDAVELAYGLDPLAPNGFGLLDLDNDNDIDGEDLSLYIFNSSNVPTLVDFNNDGFVDELDTAIFSFWFGSAEVNVP